MTEQQDWYAVVDVVAVDGTLTPEILEKVTGRLQQHGGVVSFAQDGTFAGAHIAVTAASAGEAVIEAERLVHSAFEQIPLVTVGLSVTNQERQQAELEQPQIPPLVGYIEIAGMAGVSRQRARQFADLPGFPPAVVETAAGPLRLKSAVAAWLASRNKVSGRPRTSTTA